MTDAKTYRVSPDDFDGYYLVAKSSIDGSYIGLPEYAQTLEDMGIAPQAVSGNNVASIGFCEAENKWYGWSHRAMCGFGVGSKVSRGDCAYVPTDWEDLISDAILFWDDEGHEETNARRSTDRSGKPCVKVQWVYSSDPKVIPNTKIHGTTGGANMYPPEVWGRGEWVAETLDDAKQMAMDFAEGVA
jgi:hypothetical protein